MPGWLGQTHLDLDSERRHPEASPQPVEGSVEGAFASTLRQALAARSGWVAGVVCPARPNAFTLLAGKIFKHLVPLCGIMVVFRNGRKGESRFRQEPAVCSGLHGKQSG